MFRIWRCSEQKLLARTGLLTIAEVSDLLGFHDVTLRNWVRAGKLPAVRISGQWRFDPAELAGWVEARLSRHNANHEDNFLAFTGMGAILFFRAMEMSEFAREKLAAVQKLSLPAQSGPPAAA